jgi:hypothetical protein
MFQPSRTSYTAISDLLTANVSLQEGSSALRRTRWTRQALTDRMPCLIGDPNNQEILHVPS